MIIELIDFREVHLPMTYNWIQEEWLKKNFLLSCTVTLKTHKQWYERVRMDKTQKIWAITVDMIHVGNIGLKNINLKNKNTETWIYIGDIKYHGKGIASKAYQILFDNDVFKSYNFHKVYSHVAEWNIVSRKMFIKNGFILEGVLKDEILFQNEFITLNRYSKFL